MPPSRPNSALSTPGGRRRIPRSAGRVAGLLLVLALVWTAPAEAQRVWWGSDRGPSLWLEVLKPDAERIPLSTSVWYLGGSVRLSSVVSAVAELPLAHRGERERRVIGGRPFVEEAATALGNPYLGLEIDAGPRIFFLETGVRLPLAPNGNGALEAGFLTDHVDRLEAWSEGDLLAVDAAANLVPRAASGIFGRIRAGPSFFLPVDGGSAEVTVVYGGQLGWEGDAVRILAGLTGRGFLTAAVGARHQLGGSAGLRVGRFLPSVQVRVPVEGGSPDVVYGLGLETTLPR